jgi:hypothetical protein
MTIKNFNTNNKEVELVSDCCKAKMKMYWQEESISYLYICKNCKKECREIIKEVGREANKEQKEGWIKQIGMGG